MEKKEDDEKIGLLCGMEVKAREPPAPQGDNLRGTVVELRDGWAKVQCVDEKWGIPLGTHWFRQTNLDIIAKQVD